ncbi:MAG: SDR family NAD(P)-dependent oxidoreductase [Burkholderiaceae bacterium]
MRLDERVVVVTGGASGIGLATIERCLEEGAKVILADLPASQGESLAGELSGETQGRCEFQPVDVASTDSVDRLFNVTVSRYGRVDCVFSNAGIGRRSAIADCPDQDHLAVIDINLNGVFRVARAALRVMLAQGHGSIVNCASVIGSMARPHLGSYAAAKGGVHSLTRAMALEASPRGVRVNSVSPGYVDTPIIAHQSEEGRRHLVSLHPIGRLGQPREIANAVLFLLSEESSFVTGADLAVDGGFTAGKP